MSTLEPAARVDNAGRFRLFMSRLQMKHGRKLVIALPYVWLLLLFLLPFLIVCILYSPFATLLPDPLFCV